MTDLCGKTFGRLVVVKRVADYVSSNGHSKARYFCLCACGKTTVIRGDRLTSGATTSCGCKKTQDDVKTANCAFHPFSVDCSELKCDSCGWNPFNNDLREKRIMKLLRKDGTDE